MVIYYRTVFDLSINSKLVNTKVIAALPCLIPVIVPEHNSMDASHQKLSSGTRPRWATSKALKRKAKAQFDLDALAEQASAAARILRLIGNERRLLILCFLAANGEMRAGELMSVAGLGQSALSQHLAKMRAAGLVAFRRESQTLHYRISDPRAARILNALKDIYCDDIPQTTKRRR